MRNLFQEIKFFFIDLFFPPFCAGCNCLGTYLCEACYLQIEFLLLPIKIGSKEKHIDTILSLSNYAPPVSKLIQEMKYQSVKDIAELCGTLLSYSLNIPPANYITAVPLHYKRQNLRGFNQAEEIAKSLSKKTLLPYLPLLVRKIHAPPQAEIKNKNERLTRLQNAYAPNQKIKNLKQFAHSTCLLIDDVTTTGTTLNECARILKTYFKCKKVIGITVAHGT